MPTAIATIHHQRQGPICPATVAAVSAGLALARAKFWGPEHEHRNAQGVVRRHLQRFDAQA
eukprot:5853300-Prorocentrum_lima.AAC.1